MRRYCFCMLMITLSLAVLQAAVSAAQLPPSGHYSMEADTSGKFSYILDVETSGKGKPRVVRFSPDGQWLAVATRSYIILYDVRTYAELWAVPLPNGSGVAFSPDSTMLAVLGKDAVTLLRSLDGLRISVMPIPNRGSYAYQIAFNGDGSLLAVAPDDGITRVWRVRDGTLLYALAIQEAPVTAMLFTSDGLRLVTAEGNALGMTNHSTDMMIRIWQLSDGALVGTTSRSDSLHPLALAAEGTRLVTSQDGSGATQLWTLTQTEFSLIRTLYENSLDYANRGATFSDDGMLFAAGTTDTYTVCVWRTIYDAAPQCLAGHTSDITSLAFSADGQFIVSASLDGTVRFWMVS